MELSVLYRHLRENKICDTREVTTLGRFSQSKQQGLWISSTRHENEESNGNGLEWLFPATWAVPFGYSRPLLFRLRKVMKTTTSSVPPGSHSRGRRQPRLSVASLSVVPGRYTGSPLFWLRKACTTWWMGNWGEQNRYHIVINKNVCRAGRFARNTTRLYLHVIRLHYNGITFTERGGVAPGGNNR